MVGIGPDHLSAANRAAPDQHPEHKVAGAARTQRIHDVVDGVYGIYNLGLIGGGVDEKYLLGFFVSC